MKILQKSTIKNPFFLGFIISLLGSIPLGYINIVGLQILLEKGNWATISFILGVVFVEYFVLVLVSKSAKWLILQKKLLLFIDIFTILFMSSIALYFFLNSGNQKKISLSQLQLAQFPFILGIILNLLNLIQWPYWSGVYIYLFRNKKINTTSGHNNIFMIGALIGTFLGMIIFAEIGKYFILQNKELLYKYLNAIFATLFFVLAILQIAKLFWKKSTTQ